MPQLWVYVLDLDGWDGNRLQLETFWADVFNLNAFVGEKMTKIDHAPLIESLDFFPLEFQAWQLKDG